MNAQFIRTYKWTIPVVAIVLLGIFPTMLQAQATARYAPGCEGIEGPSLPPPGFYFRDYNYFYSADHVNDNNGDRIPQVFNAFVYAQVSKLVWSTNVKVLGANLVVDGFVPEFDENVTAGSFHGDTFDMGDPFAGANLAWHLKQWDFAAGAGCWFPAGKSAMPPTTEPGMGFWEAMLTGGATWYPDLDKRWSVSGLGRLEINGPSRNTHITTGDVCTLDWAAAYAPTQTTNVGVAGYFQQQVTTSDGLGASDTLPRVAAAGPEGVICFPNLPLFVSLAYYYEFEAKDRAQGQTVNLILTYRF